MKIIVVMKNWLGDQLFQMPALDLIKQKHPGAEITCIAPERCRELMEAHPAVSGFLAFDEKTSHRSWLRRVDFVWNLRLLGPWDEGYLFHRSRSRAAMLFFSGVKKRIGYQKGRKMFLSTAVEEPSEKLHHLDHVMALMQGAGYDTPASPQYHLYDHPEDAAEARTLLEENGIGQDTRYICFHLGANWELKRWPTSHFSMLADMIVERRQIPVVVTGSPHDTRLLMEFTRNVRRAKIIPMVGKSGLRVLMQIYRKAECLVTADSGPMHIAAAVGTPVVALFGPTDPELTGPRGTGPSVVLQHIPDGYCVPFVGDTPPPDGWLCHISPQQVLDGVEHILNPTSGAVSRAPLVGAIPHCPHFH